MNNETEDKVKADLKNIIGVFDNERFTPKIVAASYPQFNGEVYDVVSADGEGVICHCDRKDEAEYVVRAFEAMNKFLGMSMAALILGPKLKSECDNAALEGGKPSEVNRAGYPWPVE